MSSINSNQTSKSLLPIADRPLPPGWESVKLGDVCEINPRRPANFERGHDAPTTFVPMASVDAIRGAISKPENRPFAEVEKGYTFFADGDVLFAKITPCMQNGKHAIAENCIDGIGFASTEFHVIRPGSRITAAWIHAFLRQPDVLHEATNHFTGAVGQQRVPDDYLGNLKIPLPPISFQNQSMRILKDQLSIVERVRAAGEAQLKMINDLPAALLRRVFSGEI